MNEHEEHAAKLAICKIVDSPMWLHIGAMLEQELAKGMLNAPDAPTRENISKEHSLMNRFCSRLIEIANSVRGNPNG
jgi:hypothetical protein